MSTQMNYYSLTNDEVHLREETIRVISSPNASTNTNTIGFSAYNAITSSDSTSALRYYSASAGATNSTPPKITSTLTKGKSVIKPIAFKPLSRRWNDGSDGHQYGSTPILTKSLFHVPHYGSSNDLLRQSLHASNYIPVERKLRSASPIAMSSLPLFINRKLRNGYDSLDNINLRNTPPTYNFKDSTAYSKSSFRSMERVAASEGSGSILDLTSLPCESTSVAEMEVALRERDYELSYLRQTMEHNEQVIFKVYQEKEHTYERELRKLKTLYENRLRTASQKSLKLEQMLMIQTYQLQEEKKKLKEENIEASGEITALREEIDALRVRLEETEWKFCQKSGELTHIMSQLEDSQDERHNYNLEISSLKNEIKQLKSNMSAKETEIDSLKEQLTKNGITDKSVQSEIFTLLGHLENEVTDEEQKYCKIESEKINEEERENALNLIEKIKVKISSVIKKWHQERNSWENERTTWIAEKEKVLRYQKQLQLSYIEMFRRKKTLETEIENLALELHLNSKSHGKKSLKNITHASIQS